MTVENLSAADSWDALEQDPDAVLVDVRTDAEWNYVGIPNLAPLGRRAVLIPWQVYPTMQVNPGFVAALERAGVPKEARVFFLCRSGARSLAAAQAAQAVGYAKVVNIGDGFEGPIDSEGHRGTIAGWKVAGLPWIQR